MTIADWLMIVAVFLGPVIAVQLTRFLDDRKETRGRKLAIFKVLMATRAQLLAPSHVEALNRIDLEFSGRRKDEKPVVEAWKAYLDLLGDKAIPPDQWVTRRIDLLVDMLQKMAAVLRYDFDKVRIKNSAYAPRFYGDLENEQQTIRRGFVELMEGKRVVPVVIIRPPKGTSGDLAADKGAIGRTQQGGSKSAFAP